LATAVASLWQKTVAQHRDEPTEMPTSIAAAPTREDFFELDCLRGIAMCLVFGIHAEGIVNWMYRVPPDVSLWRSFIYGSHTAPTLFFVLSAFLLSRPFLAELRGGRQVNVPNYFARRALRIVPMYATVVLIAIVVTAQSAADVLQRLPYLVFGQALPNVLPGMDPFSGPWWTVSTEVEFYLLLPLLAWAARSRRGRAVAVSFLAAYLGIYGALAVGWLRFSDWTQYGLAHSALGRGPSFLVGILAAVAYDRQGAAVRACGARHGWRARLAGDVLIVGTVLALGALLQWNVTAGNYVDLERAWPVWRIAESLLWATVMLLLISVPMHVKPLFANRAVAYVGVTSYSIYLLHTPVLLYGRAVIRAWFPGTLAGWAPASATAVFVLACIVLTLATITYRLIERPAMLRKLRVPLWAPTFGGSVPTPAIAGSLAGARLHHAPPRSESL
jgi:peptidoglycan/LPS O-acetylase OafA/YrhL